MNKLDMQSVNMVDENIEKIGRLFPNVIVESEKGKSIDFDLLKQELSNNIVEGNKEKYQLTWPGKKGAILTANTPTKNTLRPIKEESVDFEGTKNIFIEGDNLEVLKILQESYLNKIKMIYIDPPYNTGKDFIYKDSLIKSNEQELIDSGQIDEEDNKLITNSNTNGRYHSDWLSMIYSRIKLGRNLLEPEGIMYISIDDNEVDNLRKICDEIFGENNFIAQIIVDGTPKNDPYIVSTAHEYCLVYVKDFEKAKMASYGVVNPLYKQLQAIYDENKGDYNTIEKKLREFYVQNKLNSENISNYKYADEKGIYRIGPIDDPQRGGPKDERINPKTGKNCMIPMAGWRCNIDTWNKWIKENLIIFPEEDNVLPAKKTYISENRLDVMKAYFKIQTRKDTDYLKKLFGLNITPFSNPKPKELLKNFIRNCNSKEFIALDFFAGSGTLGESIVEVNAEDNGKRKYILVQIPQQLNIGNSQSSKEKKIIKAAIDYLKNKKLPINIAEITKERIRLSSKRIKDEKSADIDYGFRVFKVDSSNMKDIYYIPSELKQAQLNLFESNIKKDRTNEDLLTQVILDLGFTLDLKIEEKSICNNKVYLVDENSLVACFDDEIDINIVDEICKYKPSKVVFKDSSFKYDNDKINLQERFKKLSPETEINIL